MANSKEENSYSNILKRLSAFGGVQIFNIFISLIRGKFVALFLGPAGMGISSLYTSSLAPLQQICGLGLNLAVVKEIAANKDDESALRRVLKVALRLLLLTSLLGGLVTLIAAPLWSEITFGNNLHTSAYLLLSLFTALSIAGAGLLALLQGLGEVKRLSKATLVGGLAGLIFGVPLYYFYADGGIVPAMIILALASFLFYLISYRKSQSNYLSEESEIREEKEEKLRSVNLIKSLLSMGFILLVGSLAGQLITYLINLYIRSAGSLDDVGLFQGANSITNQYVGVIISALALDYFPRLSASCAHNDKMREVVNRQTEVVMLVATPLIILLLLTAPIVIHILLTDNFMVIIPLIRWMGLGMLIQALAFPLGYIYVAKDDRKAYIWMECVWANLCWLICSVGFYHIFGLIGLGISLVVRGVVDLIINYIVCLRRYGFRYSSSSFAAIAASLLLASLTFLSSLIEGTTGYATMVIFFILSASYSFRSLKGKIKKG